jgi:hypothetical protein
VSYTYIPRYLVLFLFFIFTSDYGLIDNTRSGPSKVALNADRYQLEGECSPPQSVPLGGCLEGSGSVVIDL